jgi:bifunctional UDP-N-acetylglucosamine pyrophosphorylase/glucosamine-1-phosphate N-acetyltransferase
MSTLASTSAIILAAGQGTRMKSGIPKVLHAIAGRPLVHYPVAAALDAGCGEVVVVVGHGRAEVAAYLTKAFGGRVKTAIQEQQRGTGDAARAGMTAIGSAAERVLIFYGDVPLLTGEDLAPVATALGEGPGLALATCTVDDPSGYGRVLRDAKCEVVEIREQRDLRTDSERAVREINPGIYAAGVALIREGLAGLQPNNAQGELYLTDLVAHARGAGERIVAVPSRAEVLAGVNDRHQLADADRAMVERIAKKWRVAGVTVRDGARIESGVHIEQDATIESGVVLRGETRVGRGALVDVGCVLTNVTVGEGAVLKPYTIGTDSAVGPRAQIGPFAHLRPESDIGEDAHVGNFVETKKTRMAKGSKANHLAYLGDGVIGAGANIGAGTIFCNYDGFQKHTTTIEDGAFIGSDSQLVAPVTIGKNAYVGTGTTVTKSVPPDGLALSRVRQENKEGYATILRRRMKAAKDGASAAQAAARSTPEEAAAKKTK